MKNLFLRAVKAWDRFWFAPMDLLGLGAMRVVLCSVMAVMYGLRLWNLDYYTDQSWIPRSKALLIFPEMIRPAFAWFFWPDSLNLPIHLVLVLLLVLLTVGIGGRWIMWLAWILDMGFIQRDFAVNFGADVVCSLFLFYMLFTQSCERLSVVNLIRPKKTFKKSDFVTSALIRMMQIQLAVIYAYTGFEKLKGGTWWDGTALWNVMANPQMVAFDMSFLRHVPLLIVAVSFSTMIFEIYFPAAMLNAKVRPWWFLLGLGFHMGIAVLMGLMPFSLAMLSAYFLFMNPLEMKQALVSLWEYFRKAFSSAAL